MAIYRKVNNLAQTTQTKFEGVRFFVFAIFVFATAGVEYFAFFTSFARLVDFASVVDSMCACMGRRCFMFAGETMSQKK